MENYINLLDDSEMNEKKEEKEEKENKKLPKPQNLHELLEYYSTQIINDRSLTILSHGYLLPELTLHCAYKDMEEYVKQHNKIPSIFMINYPPHIYDHFRKYCQGIVEAETTIKDMKRRRSSNTLRIETFFEKYSQNQSQSTQSDDSMKTKESQKVPFGEINHKIGIEKRKELYKNGGIFFVTTRILISDLISNEFYWNNAIFYFYDIEKVQYQFNIPFISQVFLSLTKNKKTIRCFTQRPHELVRIPHVYQRVREIMKIEKVNFFSYTHPMIMEIRKSTSQLCVDHLKLELNESMKIIEKGLFETMQYISKEIQQQLHIQPPIPDEKLLFGDYEKIVNQYNKGIDYKEDVAAMLVDLQSLRHLMLSLYFLNPVLFFIQFETMRLLVWGEDSLFWWGKKPMENVKNAISSRLWENDKFVIEKQPKHLEMMTIIEHENEKGNDVVIVVKNEQTKQELIHSWNVDDGVLLDVYQQWFDKKKELDKHIKEVHLKYRNDSKSKLKKFKIVRNENMQMKKMMSEENIIEIKDDEEDEEKEYNDFESKDKDEKDEIKGDDEIIIDYTDVMNEMSQKFYATQQIIIQQTQQRLSQMKTTQKQFVPHEYKQPVNKIVTQNELNNCLYWDKPKAIILYNCSLWVTRVLEIYAHTQTEKVKLYMLTYKNSYEAMKYQQSIEREKTSFEKLIQLEKEQRDSSNGEEQEFMSLDNRNETIIVDIREFRSELPFHLFNNNFKLIPKQIEIGDFILSPNIAVERKSIIDLIGSLKSRRINKQVQNMLRKYQKAVLLIECYSTNGFEQYDVSKAESLIKSHIDSLTALICEFPQLKVIWSYSPQMTCNIFRELKKEEAQPREEDCRQIEEDDGITNWNAIEVLKRMPGIPSSQIYEIQHTPNLTFSKMLHMNEDELKKLIGDDKGVKDFMHAINFEFK